MCLLFCLQQELCSGWQDGLSVLHLGGFQAEGNSFLPKLCVCPRNTGLGALELVSLGKLPLVSGLSSSIAWSLLLKMV